MADLSRTQSRNSGDFAKRETGEVVQIDNAKGLGQSLSQLFHEQPDFHDLFSALGAHLLSGRVVAEHAIESTAFQRQTVTGKVHQNLAHGTAHDGIEMAPVLDVPAAFVEVPEPDFMNEFGG
ncbi:hypothetical protein SBA3_2500005 [Candidatus Sulfopaludibacter sp. SbA3]|nr:hypothetical protein SBA3_2500005 [Candidatus Sulfopaludibacter sp. SbA3]